MGGEEGKRGQADDGPWRFRYMGTRECHRWSGAAAQGWSSGMARCAVSRGRIGRETFEKSLGGRGTTSKHRRGPHMEAALDFDSVARLGVLRSRLVGQ